MFKKALNYLLPVLVFIILLSIYFKPEFFDGKYLSQNDVQQGIASGVETTVFREATGEEALWSGRIFSGMPTYMLNTVYSGDWTEKMNSWLRFLPHTADAIFLNFLGFYILLICFGVRPLLAAIGGFAYAFTTYTFVSAEAGHLFKLLALAYLPLIYGAIHLIFTGKKWLGFALLALGTGLELVAQHYQITFYGFILAFIMTVFYLWELRGNLKGLLLKGTLVLLGIIVGVGPSTARLWGMLEYAPYSIRGEKELVSAEVSEASSGLDKEYAFSWSQGIWETMTIVIPRLYGGGSSESLGESSNVYKALSANNVDRGNALQFTENVPMYWGDMPFTSGPVYFGIIMFVLFILGLFTISKKQKLWLVIGAVFFLLLSFGKNLAFFNYFIFDYIPGFNKFRAVSMSVSIVNIPFLLIGVLGLSAWLNKDKKEAFELLKKSAMVSLGVIVGVWLITLFFFNFSVEKDLSYKFPDWLMAAIREDRKSFLNKDALRSLFFAGMSLLLLYLYSKEKLKSGLSLGLLAFLAILDLWTVDKRYINDKDFKNRTVDTQVQKDAGDNIILTDTTLSYRVLDLNNPFNNGLTSFYHKSIGGYHPAKMQRYQDLIERQISKNNQAVLDMLNTKYLKTTDPENPVYPRNTNLGNAWFVDSIQYVQSANEEIEALTDFNPSKTGIIDQSKFNVTNKDFETDSTSKIVLETYAPNKLVYSSSNNKDGLAVFSEIYYPKGWNAFIDGEPAKYIRANYVLRAMEVPAGTHSIEWRFEPKSYIVGNKISLAFSILIVLSIVAAIGLEIRKNKKLI
ncbi:MAG: YfhO family protein [Cytophagales bacterium]|nr:YfhO family protein [Cytophagales bacterium]